MRDGIIRVGVASPRLHIANPKANLAAHMEVAQQAYEVGIKVLVFPELSLSAYTCGDLFYQPTLLSGCEEALALYVEASREWDMISFVGLPLRVMDKLYNCAAVICGGRILGIVPKTYIPGYYEFYETRHFCAAPSTTKHILVAGQQVPFGTKLLFECREMPALRVAVEICEDLWVSVPPSCSHTAAGATVVVNLSASNELVDKAAYRGKLISTHSSRTRCVYLYANCNDSESGTDAIYSGNSFICENGKVLSEEKPFAGNVLNHTEVDVERVQTERRRIGTFEQNEQVGYEVVPFDLTLVETPIVSAPPAMPFVPQCEEEREERCNLILNIQSHGLAGRMERAHCDHLVLGVSGGLDSTLALLVAVRALELRGLDRSHVVSVTMPGFGTTKRTKSNAQILAEKLGTTLRTIDISKAVSVHFEDIGHDPENHNVVYENAQARERTQILMNIANAVGGLVVGTGDLSELALGWATYNGDHMSMYGVNGGIPKTLVRYLVACEADRFASKGEGEVADTLRDILATPVSPELLPPKDGEISQCTEGIVGPYDLHDYFLYHLVRRAEAPRKILRLAKASFAGVYDEATIRTWLCVFIRRFFAQQFKRSCLPDGPKVGSVSLSPRTDWRMPSDADVAAWLEEIQ